MADSGSTTSPRRMKFPYTYSARIAQFPYKYYWRNSWLLRYYCYSIVLCAPVFYSIQKLSYSPANVATWEEKRRQEFEGHHK